MASAASHRLTRDEYKKQRELEELRKSGAVPAALDEDGKMINPHIPNYISQAPWYLNASHPSLKHQKADFIPALSDIHRYQRRGLQSERASSFRKGACENCGSMTHKAKECVERPRKRGARHTGRDIMPDEVLDSVDLSFDGKRDRWNGYNAESYQEVIDHYQRTDQARLERKTAELEQQEELKVAEVAADGDEAAVDSDSDDGSDSDDDLKDNGVDFQKRDARTRTTVRNLRIREDRAKYLINLDTKSAYYDSKSRSMRENPHENLPADEVAYAGDNFVMKTGDVRKFAELTSYAWETDARGDAVPMNPTAVPSQAEYAFKAHKEKKDAARQKKKRAILEKYGGDQAETTTPNPLLQLGQSELYTEYAPDGKVIKGPEPVKVASKYVEDLHENGHTTVFGSYFNDGKWGFRCCHSTLRNAYCTGAAGKVAPAPIPQHSFASVVSR